MSHLIGGEGTVEGKFGLCVEPDHVARGHGCTRLSVSRVLEELTDLVGVIRTLEIAVDDAAESIVQHPAKMGANKTRDQQELQDLYKIEGALNRARIGLVQARVDAQARMSATRQV
jgi:hypothetical protein